MLKLNHKILNICLQSMMKNIGYYEINFGKICYTINMSDLSKKYKDKDTCILKLPSINEIKTMLLTVNRFLDLSEFDDIQYNFVNGQNFDKSIVIKSNSNVVFSDYFPYNLKNDVVIHANYVAFNSCFVLSDSKLKINANTIYVNCSGLKSDSMEFKANGIFLLDSNLSAGNINVDNNNMVLSSSEMYCTNLDLKSDEIKKDNNSVIKAKNSTINKFNNHLRNESSESLDKNPVLKIVK